MTAASVSGGRAEVVAKWVTTTKAGAISARSEVVVQGTASVRAARGLVEVLSINPNSAQLKPSTKPADVSGLRAEVVAKWTSTTKAGAITERAEAVLYGTPGARVVGAHFEAIFPNLPVPAAWVTRKFGEVVARVTAISVVGGRYEVISANIRVSLQPVVWVTF